MGHGHKGHFVSPMSQTTLVAPVLSPAGTGTITWTYAGSTPAFWIIMQSTTQFGSYSPVNHVAGTTHTQAGLISGRWEFVYGAATGTGTPPGTTPNSNTVQVP